MTQENHLISGLKWVAMGRLFSQVINWSMTFFVLRLLAPSDYGLVALSTAVTVLFGLIAEFGFAAALTQAKIIEKRQLASLFGIALLLNFAITSILIISAPLVSIIYSEDRLTAVIQVAACQFIITALAILPDARLRREMRFRELAKIDFISGSISGGLTFIFAYIGLGYWSLVLSPLCGSALRTLLLHIRSGSWVWPSLSLKPAKELIIFGGLTMFGRIAGHLLSQMDILIAGIFFGKDALGVYSVAMQLASMPLSKIMGVINQVASPSISRMNHDGKFSGEALLHGGKMIAYLLFPILWGLASVAPFIVNILMGDKWSGAIIPLQLVCLALPFRAISTLLTTSVSALGRADIEVYNTLTGCLILPICFLIGIRYGVMGLSLAWVVGIPIVVFFNVRRSKTILGISGKDLLVSLLYPILITGIMYATMMLFTFSTPINYDSVWHLIASIFVGVISYTLAFFFIDRKFFIIFLRLTPLKSNI